MWMEKLYCSTCLRALLPVSPAQAWADANSEIAVITRTGQMRFFNMVGPFQPSRAETLWKQL